MAYEKFETQDLTLRDKLAIDRTRLANERTMLAYLRTAFMLIIAGATAVRLFGDVPGMLITGWALLVFGAAAVILGAWRYVAMRGAIEKAADRAHPGEANTE